MPYHYNTNHNPYQRKLATFYLFFCIKKSSL